MQLIDNLDHWHTLRAGMDKNLTLGFVPTMGNLHAGHRSLIKRSQQENKQTIVSIFINPTQFNNQDDFIQYPYTLDDDLKLLQNDGVQYCLLPTEQSIYPQGFRYQIQETALTKLLEGKHRPGHFAGVLTIVMKLLNIVRPNQAYFGEKDYQQYLLIRDMATDFFLDTQITSCPTIREKSGLAYSSRNNRLSPIERSQAEQFAQLFHQGNTCVDIRKALENRGIRVDYIEDYSGRRFAAVYIGTIRLIDNYQI
ncbi:MAG: pantoate--beta-alanine ligase [Legionellales bacterium RIFCSPHIGHO2_12_FULL_42_9]|nr:MAG: pantoate--beta-alanine ligase [Legionellales bacterium RIFCSPHIGHO2_12_FULL_42_9]